MTTLDPLAAAGRIRESYKRYLESRHAPRDPRLRQEFHDALESGLKLTRGPILQASPPFEPGAAVSQLVDEATLHGGFDRLGADVFPIQRPLYRHQEQAIRKVLAGRNVIVATGTGSGKTECYLFPILDDLLREQDAGTLADPGVRAMFLYPMNALANDQMKRLRDVLGYFPEITFGRFVGDTREKHREAAEIHRARFGGDPQSNELISREQIRATPPHILLTNYAMLEYLLLRPADTSLFDGPTGRHWRFIVLDEIHVYSGAQGAEIAMLLRRVRDRVHASEREQLRYIGTSATLAQREGDYPRLADYAATLFDESVEYQPSAPARQDIIAPRHLPLADDRPPTWRAKPTDFAEIRGCLDDLDDGTLSQFLQRLAARAAPGSPVPDGSPRDWLGLVLDAEYHVNRLRGLLQNGPLEPSDAAHRVFGTDTADGRLVDLVDVCTRVKAPGVEVPLLPARYHFFVRALEGAFVCQSPRHPDGEPRLILRRHDQCPACKHLGHESTMFELGVCMKCGASYLLGVTEDDADQIYLRASTRADDSALRHLLVREDAIDPEESDEDERAVVADEDVGEETDQRTLCTRCGALTEAQEPSCGCGRGFAISVAVAHPARRGQPLRRCIACTGRSNGPIVLRFLTGQDAPAAVIATALYQALPETEKGGAAALVGQGRRLLSFSDSRQDAAFFAPYLDRTYSQAIQRRIIWVAAERLAGEEPRFEDLVIPIRREAERRLVLDEDRGAMHNSNRVRAWLMREILAVDRRQSLDGVGLAEIGLALPRRVRVPQPLLDQGLSEREALDIARVLLDTLRLQAAVHLPEGVDIADPAFAPRNVVTRVRQRGSAKHILSWVPGRGLNRRLDYLQKVCRRRSLGIDPAELLENIWTHWLAAPGSPWLTILKPLNDPRSGRLYAIDPERVIVRPASEEEPAFRCGTCRQIWWRSVSGVCPSYRCAGSLEPLRIQQTADHYLHLYTSLDPTGMCVEEHTGQLAAEYAGELQQRFVDGEVNVLSCSTTFELGVDVGEVQGILLRNVPPSPANYVQRAGRAGRRSGATALTVTFAQRRSHDLHYFRNPEHLVEGRIGVPMVSLRNERIVRRHIHAVAFAEFERRHVDAGGAPHTTVASFFTTGDGEDDAPVRRFVDWLRSRPSQLGDALARITPADVASVIGVDDWTWVDALTSAGGPDDDHGWLQRAEAEVRADLEQIGRELDDVIGQINRLSAAGRSQEAGRLSGLQRGLFRVRGALERRRLIDFLAQRVVLPKYGFPVDVVSLDVWREGDPKAARLDLSRDLRLGLTDYAPGSQIVADKALWETAGLRIPPDRRPPTHSWAVCSGCGGFRTRLGDDPGPCEGCAESVTNTRAGQFVIPMFGFIGRSSREKPGESRPPKAGSSEFHFSAYMSDPPEFQSTEVGRRQVRLRTSPQGQITVINRGAAGRGFRICLSCGYAEGAPDKDAPQMVDGHRRPGSRGECGGASAYRHLGHQYLTDVVEVEPPTAMTTTEARGTLYALLEAVPEIGIARGDVNGTLRPSGGSGRISLVLFDSVPGGAGHARRIAEQIADLLWAALRVVEHCECGIDSSCYGCLRSYSNQQYHDELVRGHALDGLKVLLGIT